MAVGRTGLAWATVGGLLAANQTPAITRIKRAGRARNHTRGQRRQSAAWVASAGTKAGRSEGTGGKPGFTGSASDPTAGSSVSASPVIPSASADVVTAAS